MGIESVYFEDSDFPDNASVSAYPEHMNLGVPGISIRTSGRDGDPVRLSVADARQFVAELTELINKVEAHGN